MLKIFRAIRARLLKQSKITGYLAYAVGEIFLVVVGILIALQVNNWNEQRKIRASEQKILTSIRASLLQDSMEFHNAREVVAVLNRSIETLLNNPPLHDSLTTHFINSRNRADVNIRTSAFEQLRSLGLERIQNTALRDSLVKHYDEYVKIAEKRLEARIEFFNTTIQYQFYEEHLWFATKDTSFATITYLPKNYENLINSKDFQSILVEKWLFNVQTSSVVIARLQRKTRVLLAQIEAELDEVPGELPGEGADPSR